MKFNLKKTVAHDLHEVGAVGYGMKSANDSSIKRAAVGVVGMVAAVASQAAAIDVTSTVTDIAAQAAPIALIGAAVLAIFVGLKAFKWVRRALS